MEEQRGKIAIIPTPLGNLGDMTLRAIEELKAADAVCAEDTRVTGKLLAALGIAKPLERLDENAMGERAAAVVRRAEGGERIAYCSDAGMPGVSDPGMRLVRAAQDAGVPVEVLPGPSAATLAYVASGTLCPRFYFGGFFPRKAGERTRLLESLRSLDAALIFYESPNRLVQALAAIAEALPQRRVAVCRELTKLHEEVEIGAPCELRDSFAARERASAVKGEIAIVIDPASDDENAPSASDIERRAGELAAQGLRTKEAAKLLAAECGIPRSEAYDMMMRAAHGS